MTRRNDTPSSKNTLVQILKEHRSFEIITHIQPDEDAVGAARGLALALSSLGKEVALVFPSPVPGHLDFTQAPPGKHLESPEISILVDVSDEAMLGEVKPRGKKAVIDHHRSDGLPDAACWIDPEKSSSSEMVYEVALALGAKITPAIATNLYMGLFGDTGGFMHANTTRDVLRLAYELAACGADPHAVAYRLKKTKAIAFYRMLCTAIARAIVKERVMVSYVTYEEALSVNARPEDGSGVVEELASLDGVDLVIFVREIEKGSLKASIRSRVKDAALRTAEAFGGGGHGLAAGCSMKGDPHDAVHKMLEEGLKWVRTA